MAALVLWAEEDLEAELSAEVVRQILDDDNDGTADADPMKRLRERSAAYVLGGLQRTYPTLIALATEWQADLTLVTPRLKDLALDMAIAYCAKRHPEYVRRDWMELVEFVDKQIARIRKEGLDGLATTAPPEPATNQGGSIQASLVNSEGELVRFFTGPCGLGDF